MEDYADFIGFIKVNMITKELIFYYVRRVLSTFPPEWNKFLKGVRIKVHSDEIQFDFEKDRKEILGSWNPTYKMIEFFIPTLVSYVANEKDVETAQQKVESVVEHELLHGIGLNHDQIHRYREEKKLEEIRRK